MSPAASPRARRNSTQESEFADLRFSALIGTGSFGRVYKGKPCGHYLDHPITRMLLSQPQHCRLACIDMCRLACVPNAWVQKLVSGGSATPIAVLYKAQRCQHCVGDCALMACPV